MRELISRGKAVGEPLANKVVDVDARPLGHDPGREHPPIRIVLDRMPRDAYWMATSRLSASMAAFDAE